MHRTITGLTLILASLGAHAALLGHLPATPGGTDFQAYYDTVLNVTWLADANLAATNTFGVDGICFDDVPPCFSTPSGSPAGAMDWYISEQWIAAMNAANYLGVDDWRLPSMDLNGDGTVFPCEFQVEVACRDNELGYMHYINGVSLAAPGPFANVAGYVGIGYYGSGTEYAIDPSRRWLQNFGIRIATSDSRNPKTEPMYEWPVRPGDIGTVVPVPAAAWLLGSALGLLGWVRSKVLP